jgi:hypothetical protein
VAQHSARSLASVSSTTNQEVAMISVQVCSRQSGRPLRGYRVTLGFSGFFGGVTASEYTDSDGHAHFSCDPGSGEVYVSGKSVFKGTLRGRIVVYV